MSVDFLDGSARCRTLSCHLESTASPRQIGWIRTRRLSCGVGAWCRQRRRRMDFNPQPRSSVLFTAPAPQGQVCAVLGVGADGLWYCGLPVVAGHHDTYHDCQTCWVFWCVIRARGWDPRLLWLLGLNSWQAKSGGSSHTRTDNLGGGLSVRERPKCDTCDVVVC